MGKITFICLTGLKALLLLMWKWMGLFLKKNHLLRYCLSVWLFISKMSSLLPHVLCFYIRVFVNPFKVKVSLTCRNHSKNLNCKSIYWFQNHRSVGLKLSFLKARFTNSLLFLLSLFVFKEKILETMHKEWSFPLICLVNLNKTCAFKITHLQVFYRVAVKKRKHLW